MIKYFTLKMTYFYYFFAALKEWLWGDYMLYEVILFSIYQQLIKQIAQAKDSANTFFTGKVVGKNLESRVAKLLIKISII